MKNKLSDLNNLLFEQLERLQDDELKGDDLDHEIARSKAVTSIGDFAFADCTKLKSVTIPRTVSSIGKNAFKGCKNLKRINVPASAMSQYKRLLPKFLHKKLVEF